MIGKRRRLAVPRPARLPACLALALGLVLGPPAVRTAAGQASDPDPERVRLLHEASDRYVVAVDGGGGELRLGAQDEPGSVFELIVLEEAGDAATDVVALGTGDGIHFVRFPRDGRVDARATIQAGDPRLELESVPVGGSERTHLSHGGRYLQVISGELRALPLSSEPRELSEAERVASAFRLEPASRGTAGARRRSRPSAADPRPALEDLVGRGVEDRIRQPAVERGVPAADAGEAPVREVEEAEPREAPVFRAPRARARVRLARPAPPPTEVAFTPDGGWVIVRGEDSFARNIPDEAYRKLHEFLDADKPIDAIAFTPDGGWTIVAGERSWTRNVKGHYYETVQNLLAAGGIRVLDVAFNPADWESEHGFVIVYDAGKGETGFIASGIPNEMRRKMEEYTADGTPIDAVAFTPEGGWTFVADQKRWTRNVGGPSPSYYETLKRLVKDGARIQAVAFNPADFDRRKGYVILTASQYRARGIPAEMSREIEETLGYDPGRDQQLAGPEDAADRQVVARSKTAVIDLQKIVIKSLQERRGDEPYMVVYPLRGRLGVGDRVLVFDHEKQIGMIRSERNWAKAGMSYDIPSKVGKVSLENVKPFEVYGVVLVFAERDPGTSQNSRIAAFGSGIFKDDEGIFEVVADRFNRAVPFDTRTPDYDDVSASNVRDVVAEVFGGIRRYFDDSFRSQVMTTFEKYTRKGNGDDLLSVSAMFFMNAPGLTDDEVAEIARSHVLRPGSFSDGLIGAMSSGGIGIWAADMNWYDVRGEHRFFATGGKE